MKFKYSNTEHTYTGQDGKRNTYSVCDICRTEQKSNYGLDVQYTGIGRDIRSRISLCGKCANKILPILEDALRQIDAIRYNKQYLTKRRKP